MKKPESNKKVVKQLEEKKSDLTPCSHKVTHGARVMKCRHVHTNKCSDPCQHKCPEL